MATTQLSHVLHSPHSQRPFLIDITYVPNEQPKPVIVFLHGFKGFKDWGPFNVMAHYFAEKGFVFVKINFSHNGTTPDDPLNFADLEAFGHDNHSIQLDDLGVTIEYIQSVFDVLPPIEYSKEQLYLLGHSRGGSVAILKAAENPHVKKVATWAAVSDLISWYTPEEVEAWKTSGVRWIANGRTKQQMPIYYQYYQDLFIHQDRLDILKAASKLKQPLFLIHGDTDETVPQSAAQTLYTLTGNSLLEIISGGNHTFGGSHPYPALVLPPLLHEVCDKTISFFLQK